MPAAMYSTVSTCRGGRRLCTGLQPLFFLPVNVHLVSGGLCNIFYVLEKQYRKSLAPLSPAEGALWGPGIASSAFSVQFSKFIKFRSLGC